MAVSMSLGISLVSQDSASNTSKVNISLTSTQTGQSHNLNTLTGYYWISVNGGAETKYSFTCTLPYTQTVTLFSTDYTFAHRTDGTGSISVRSSIDTRISAGTVEKSASLTPSKITPPAPPEPVYNPTTPTLSADPNSMDSFVTIYTSGQLETFTHDLFYYWGSAEGTIATGVTTDYTWKIPLELANYIPNNTKGTGTIRCKTYNGSKLVGIKDINFTATIPTSVVPVINSVTLSDPMGYAETYGGYVQDKSKLKVQVSASGSYSSTITNVKIDFDGTSSIQNPYITNLIQNSGERSVVVTVTDSRERTINQTININVFAYTSPTIVTFKARRCDENGNLDDAGDHMILTYHAKISPIDNKNGKNILVRYRPQNTSEWISAVNQSVYELDSSVIVAADTNKSYYLSIVATDNFGSVEKTWKLSTAYTLMDFRSTGMGIAFGKVSEKNGIECGMSVDLIYGIMHRGKITSDFNNATDVGKYMIEHRAELQNHPCPPYGGALYVTSPLNSNLTSVKGSGSRFFVQIFLTWDAQIYIRNMYCTDGINVSFGAWKTVVS